MKTKILSMAVATMLLSADGMQAQEHIRKKVLVAYFSHSGNTRAMARQIGQATGGDLFEIEPQRAYPAEYRAVVDQAKKEVADGFRPRLKTQLENMAQYDVIFVGSPCWWYTIAPPVAAFLASNDFSGKIVVPFMTHEGSGMGHSEEDIRALCPGAAVMKGLPVRGGAVGRSQAEVLKWVEGLNLSE